MEKREAIERLCALTSLVMKHDGYKYASDCFCGETSYGHYQNDGRAVEFIEEVVRKALAERGV